MPNSKPIYRPSDWTRNDILYLVQQVDQGKYVLVADQRLGLPHINMHFPAEVKHAGMGLMFIETTAYKLTFDAGGAMQKTEPSGHGWSELRVVEGTYPLDLAGLRTQLIELLTLPVEPAQAQAAAAPEAIAAMDEPPTTPRPAPVEATVAPEPVAVQAGQEPIQTSITKPVVTATLPSEPAPVPAPVEAATFDFQTVELPEDNGETSSEDESEDGEGSGEGEAAADCKPATAVAKKIGYQAPPPPVNHVTQAPYTWEKCLRTVTIAYLPVKDGEGQQVLVGVRTHEDPWKVHLFNEQDAPLPTAILAMLEEVKAEMPMKAMQALEKATKEKVKKKPVAAIKSSTPASAPSVTTPKAGGTVAKGTAPTGAQLDLFSMLAGG
jgi:hypothetical protein